MSRQRRSVRVVGATGSIGRLVVEQALRQSPIQWERLPQAVLEMSDV